MSRRSANGQRPPPPPQPADWDLQYQPSPRTPLEHCQCGAAYLDDAPSRAAHVAVFGHSPAARESASPPKEPPS